MARKATKYLAATFLSVLIWKNLRRAAAVGNALSVTASPRHLSRCGSVTPREARNVARFPRVVMLWDAPGMLFTPMAPLRYPEGEARPLRRVTPSVTS